MAAAAQTATGIWIDGKFHDALDGARFAVEDPSTGLTLTDCACAGTEDATRALDSACRAQSTWAAAAPRERSEVLRAAWELLTANAVEFAHLITAEMGKPVNESLSEVSYGAEFLRWYSEEAVRINGRVTRSPSGTGRILVDKVPVGPCLAITPWNFPLAMATRKIGPALAAGCTIVLKPSEETPLTALALAQVFDNAGLPAGVLSVLPTTDSAAVAGQLMNDRRLRKVSFTGSTSVGRELIARAAPNVLRMSMELGGNAPFIVLHDADIDAAVNGAMIAKMRNGGQACTAANRFLVAAPIREAFTSRLSERMAALTVGSGYLDNVDLGPLISRKHHDKVARLVDEAIMDGARLRTGGKPIQRPGYFYEATVLDNVPADARVLDEEIFGPIAVITEFETREQAIELANRTDYGLAAYVYTKDLAQAHKVSDALQFGMIGINRAMVSDPAAPFGGIKHSGLGTEGGAEGLAEYLESKYIATT
ncbi:NAD-dependent succinate-semialdehyde dehydrogenase [Nocardia sp. NPDC004860]|uniref:NAD-dependent succinate-semialdehyde dehydrogenase n=1 Tax=Nocardia sp. NPDC004860 TaxID=3154557 RepID=UPI0033A79A13